MIPSLIPSSRADSVTTEFLTQLRLQWSKQNFLRGSRFIVSSHRGGAGVPPFKAGIFENTSAMKSMNTMARVGSSLLAT